LGPGLFSFQLLGRQGFPFPRATHRGAQIWDRGIFSFGVGLVGPRVPSGPRLGGPVGGPGGNRGPLGPAIFCAGSLFFPREAPTGLLTRAHGAREHFPYCFRTPGGPKKAGFPGARGPGVPRGFGPIFKGRPVNSPGWVRGFPKLGSRRGFPGAQGTSREKRPQPFSGLFREKRGPKTPNLSLVFSTFGRVSAGPQRLGTLFPGARKIPPAKGTLGGPPGFKFWGARVNSPFFWGGPGAFYGKLLMAGFKGPSGGRPRERKIFCAIWPGPFIYRARAPCGEFFPRGPQGGG